MLVSNGCERIPMHIPPQRRAGAKYENQYGPGGFSRSRHAGEKWTFGFKEETAHNWRAFWILFISAVAIAGLVVGAIALARHDDLYINELVGVNVTRISHDLFEIGALLNSSTYALTVDSSAGDGQPITLELLSVFGGFGFNNYSSAGTPLPAREVYTVVANNRSLTSLYNATSLGFNVSLSSDATILLTDEFTVEINVPGTHQYIVDWVVQGTPNVTNSSFICGFVDVNSAATDDYQNTHGFYCQPAFVGQDTVVGSSATVRATAGDTLQLKLAPTDETSGIFDVRYVDFKVTLVA